MYEYDNVAAEESVTSANNAVSSLQSVPADMNTASSLAASVQVSGLEFLSDGSYANTIEIISNYPSIIIGMILQAERDMIIECVQNGDMSKLVQYVNDGKISTQALIEYSKEYMLEIMNSGDINSYSVGFAKIGGDNARYSNLNSALKAQGFSDEFIYNLSNEFCKNNINNDLYYKKEGVVTTAMAFQGMLSLFNLTLGYSHTEYDQSQNGFYFTSGDPNSPVLSSIDCCNYTDWLARCVGIDIAGGGVTSKHTYCADGITPSDQILAGKDSEYFKKGEGGDYLIRVVGSSQHIRMIIANDGNGYYYIENGSTSKISYESYQSLGDNEYSVTNTDAMFRNTSPTIPNDMVKYDENGNYSYSYKYSYKEQKTQVFANPYWIINQPNINLTQAEQESLIRQYNERNKNSNFTGVDFAPVTKEPTEPLKDNLPVDIDSTPPTTLNNPESTTQTQPTTLNNSEPTTQTPPMTPNNTKPTTQTAPTTSNNTEPTTQTPPTTPSNPVVNILPNDNKYSDVLPELNSGNLGYMEISSNSVSYEVANVSNSTYDDYVQALLDKGYVMSSDGSYIKDNYHVITTITQDGKMSIKLNII